jgi:putative hydrolase of the HAD superfamily
MYQALLFDLDDTLYDLRSYWRMRLLRALATLVPDYPHFDCEALARRALAERIYMMHWPDFVRGLGVENEELVALSNAVFCDGWFDEMELYEDSVPTLLQLRKRYKLGLITNGPSEIQHKKINRFGLSNYFDILIVSEDVGVEKPDPTIFEIALKQLGVGAKEAVYIGDSPEFDLCGAAAASMDAIWMNTRNLVLPSDTPKPVASIAMVSHLLEIVPT